MAGKLYIVATPIGNLSDVTYRSLNVLDQVDFVLCEDTRVTRKLFNKYKISNNLKVLNDINEHYKKDKFIDLLIEGYDLALVSDAGTPCISDPGYRIVNLAKKNKIDVVSVPGPCSVSASLSISGLPTDNFFYQGFLPKKKGRQTKFKELSEYKCTIVIFESPKRIVKTLNDILLYMGDRTVALCRELTKVYENVSVNKVSKYIEEANLIKSKGEYVIIIAKEDYEY